MLGHLAVRIILETYSHLVSDMLEQVARLWRRCLVNCVAAQLLLNAPGKVTATSGFLRFAGALLVEPRGFEPLTSAVQRRRSPN
jgi:hypothetical protein